MTTTDAQPTRPAEPLSALRYRLHLRISDVIAGHRDGSLDLATTLETQGTAAMTAPTSWLRNNQHQFLERADAELLAVHSAAHELIEGRRALVANLPALHAARTAAEHELNSVDPRLDASAAQARRATEKHLSDGDIEVRRRREHAAARAVVSARLTAATADVEAQLEKVSRTESLIITAFEGLVGRVERLREFHNRRAAAYERSYLRRFARSAESGTAHPLAAHAGMPMPAWCEGPCPWIESV